MATSARVGALSGMIGNSRVRLVVTSVSGKEVALRDRSKLAFNSI
jgi:hypothetical protein